MKKKQPHKTEKKMRHGGRETQTSHASRLRQPQTETQKEVAPQLRHLERGTHSDSACRLRQSLTETQERSAQQIGHHQRETHREVAHKNQPRNDDQQKCVTQSSPVFTTDQLCADLMVRCGRRRQYLQAHIRLLQQKESFRMMSIHEAHRDQPGIRDPKQPWKCLVCEKYRKGVNGEDHKESEIQEIAVDEQIGHARGATHAPAVLSDTQAQSPTETQNRIGKNGNDDHRSAETQNVHADFSHFDIAIAQMEEPRREIEKQIESVSVLLPVWKSWTEKTKGIGPLLLGQIVGECGNLLNYLSPAKIWKRMGLEPGAKRIRAVATKAGESAEERRRKAMEFGFSPRRRALMHVVGTSLMRAGGEYYRVYVDRKGYEEAQHPDWVNDKKEKKKHPSHLHKRAMRYMEKKFLKDLWVKWVEVEAILNPQDERVRAIATATGMLKPSDGVLIKSSQENSETQINPAD